MKGKISAHIPQRQFEFIDIEYDLEQFKTPEEAFDRILKDLEKYHCMVQKRASEHKDIPPATVPQPKTNFQTKPSETEIKIGGIAWKKVDGHWQYYDASNEKWVGSESPPLITQ